MADLISAQHAQDLQALGAKALEYFNLTEGRTSVFLLTTPVTKLQDELDELCKVARASAPPEGTIQ